MVHFGVLFDVSLPGIPAGFVLTGYSASADNKTCDSRAQPYVHSIAQVHLGISCAIVRPAGAWGCLH
jgi:hypothetical protein